MKLAKMIFTEAENGTGELTVKKILRLVRIF